ncbi:MAG: hypothetical protein IJP92_12280 [Lachnospiraceae bacterium]|nr:hypothetical protein [Lachnospiraceae bacterium]
MIKWNWIYTISYSLSLFIVSFFVLRKGILSSYAFILFIILSVFCSFILSREKYRKLIMPYLRKRFVILICLIATYFSFALVGFLLFLEESLIIVTLKRVVVFAAFAVVLVPIIYGTLLVMEKQHLVYGLTGFENDSKDIKRMGLICTVIVFAFSALISVVFYPCLMTGDSKSHWIALSGDYPLTDYSPIIFHLLISFLVRFTDSGTPYPYVIFQILLFSFAIGEMVTIMCRKGVGKKWLILLSVIIAFLPSTFMTLPYLSKNPLAAILNLWVLILLVELLSEPEFYLGQISWFIKTIIFVSGLYLIRQNHVVIALPLTSFCIWFLFKSGVKNSRRILMAMFGVVAVLFIVQRLLYGMIEYTHVEKPHETIRPLMAPVGSALQKNFDVPLDIAEAADRVLDIDEWKKRYNAYNSDPLTWGDPKPDYGALDLAEGVGIYFKMLSIYPSVVVKDRLDATELIWNIADTGVIYNIRYANRAYPDFYAAWGLDEDGWLKNAVGVFQRFIMMLLKPLIYLSEQSIIDVFVWRCGIFIVLFMIEIVFLFKNGMGKLLWAMLPSFFILLTYVLVIAWQMYFYLWFFPLATASFEMLIVCCSMPGYKMHKGARGQK